MTDEGLSFDFTFKTATYRAAAIYAARLGFSVFPCRPGGKEPLTDHGCKDATKSLDQIAEWEAKWPHANIGIACGAPSGGLLVLDLDGDEGQGSLRHFESLHGPLPHTPLSLTGRGQHYFFKTKVTVKNRVRLAPGVDIRSEGGYVIAPPSIHPNGHRYLWEVSARICETALADAPSWLIQVAGDPAMAAPAKRDWSDLTTGSVSVGSRNMTLASLAGHLFRRYVDPKVAYMLLKAWNRSCTERPLPDAEFDRTVNSIATAEAVRRREPL